MQASFETASAILMAAQIWAGLGGAVALVFLAWGIDRVEPNARGSYAFRPLLVPAILLIWPLVLWRWAVVESGRDSWAARHAPPRRAHGRIWTVLAWVIPAILLAALVLRQNGPLERPAVRLEAPK